MYNIKFIIGKFNTSLNERVVIILLGVNVLYIGWSVSTEICLNHVLNMSVVS